MPPASTVSLTLCADNYVCPGSDLLWLFAIPDDDPDGTGLPVMLSVGNGSNTLNMGRVDPLDPSTYQAVKWVQMVVNTGFWSQGSVCDHWHIFYRGEHWLSYSNPDADFLGLFKTDPSLSNASSLHDIAVISPDPNDLALIHQGFYITNDHFIVEGAPQHMREYSIGIAVVMENHVGSLFFIKLQSPNIPPVHSPERTMITSPNLKSIANGGSATVIRADPSVWVWPETHVNHLVAPTTLDPRSPSDIYLYELDFSGNFSQLSPLLLVSGSLNHDNNAMPTIVHLPNFWYVVTYRRILEGKPPLRDADGNELDYGDIVRDIFDSSGSWQSKEVLLTATQNGMGGNRPHTSVYRLMLAGTYAEFLLTCWDEYDVTTNVHSARMRVDAITLS